MFTEEDLHALLSPITLLKSIQHSVKTQRKTLFIVKVVGIKISIPIQIKHHQCNYVFIVY
jgi:hypothetical protein